MRSVAKARTSVRYDLVVAGGEAFGGQVLHIPAHVTLPFIALRVDVGGW